MKQALQNALNAIDAAVPDSADDGQQIIASKCRALMCGYHERWKDTGYQAVHIEKPLSSDLMNPATGAKSRSFQMAGVLDVIARHNNQSVLVDHKTTSMDVSPESSYWRQLAVEGQVNHYYALGWSNGVKFDSAIWDVVRKPTIRPKKLTKAERTAIVSSGVYFGVKVSDAERERLQTEESESCLLYELRLAFDCTTERPDYYFARRAVPRVDHEILEYAGELWQHGQDMLQSRRNDGLPVRNSGACMLYGSPCSYLGICSGHDTPDSDRWQRKQFVHNELSGFNGDGRDLLTNSRVRCWQTCRRKHFYQYELGIERQDEEEREALVFGHLFHLAQAAWWSFFLIGEEHGYDNGSPIYGVGERATAEAKLSSGSLAVD